MFNFTYSYIEALEAVNELWQWTEKLFSAFYVNHKIESDWK